MLYSLKEIVSEGAVGALSGFFADDSIEEIMHDGIGCVKIYHAQFGMCETNVQLSSDAVSDIIGNVVSFNGKSLSSSMPLFDGTLSDGSRINIVLSPL